jgi:putative transposase
MFGTLRERERKDWPNSRKCPVNACSIASEYIIPGDAPAPNYYQQANVLTAPKVLYPEVKTVNAQSVAAGFKKT